MYLVLGPGTQFSNTHARDKALYPTWLATSYLHAHEVEEAATTLARASDLAAGVSSVCPAFRNETVARQLVRAGRRGGGEQRQDDGQGEAGRTGKSGGENPQRSGPGQQPGHRGAGRTGCSDFRPVGSSRAHHRARLSARRSRRHRRGRRPARGTGVARRRPVARGLPPASLIRTRWRSFAPRCLLRFRSRPLGCDSLLPVLLPKGYSVTVYGPDGRGEELSLSGRRRAIAGRGEHRVMLPR